MSPINLNSVLAMGPYEDFMPLVPASLSTGLIPFMLLIVTRAQSSMNYLNFWEWEESGSSWYCCFIQVHHGNKSLQYNRGTKTSVNQWTPCFNFNIQTNLQYVKYSRWTKEQKPITRGSHRGMTAECCPTCPEWFVIGCKRDLQEESL